MKWFLKVLWHYADFSGRARRKEFWLFVLFGYIFLIAWSSLLILIFRLTEITDGETLAFVPFFSSFYFLAAMLLPVMAVIVRRLHDTGKSGWWILIGLIPGGGILLFAWMTIKGQYGTNRYGQDPKRSAEKSGGKMKGAGILLAIVCVGIMLGKLPTKIETVPILKQNDAGKYGFVTKIETVPILQQNDVGKYGFVNSWNMELIPFKYDYAEPFAEDLTRVNMNGKWGFIDRTGAEAIPLKYDDIQPFSKGLATTRLNGKWGLVDKTGAEVIPNIYDAFLYHSTGYYETILNEKKGLLDKHCMELIPPKYDEIDFSNNVLMRVKRNGKYGFIDSIGKEIVATIYDEASVFSQGKARVVLKDDIGFINADGTYTFNSRKITLAEAVRQKLVKFSGRGNSISDSYMQVTNLTDKELFIKVPAGTFLAAHSSSDQNMVLTAPVDFTLAPHQDYSQWVSTACMNIHRDIPDGESGFSIGQRPENHLLSKVIRRLNKGGYSYSVIQAAVWIVTDGASYDDVGILSSGRGRVIDRDDYQTALRIVREAQKK